MNKFKTDDMWSVQKITENLGIPRVYVKIISPKQIVCLVHMQWLKQLLTQTKIPDDFFQFGSLNDLVREQVINQLEVPSGYQWKFICIQTLYKEKKNVQRLPKASPVISTGSVDLNYFQLIHYVTDTNYRNLWKQAWRKYCDADNQCSNKSQGHLCYPDAVQAVIKRLFLCPVIQAEDQGFQPSFRHSTSQPSSSKNGELGVDAFYILIRSLASLYAYRVIKLLYFKESLLYALFQDASFIVFPDIFGKLLNGKGDGCHPGLTQVLCAVEYQDYVYLLYEKASYNLQQCIMYSPAVLETSVIRRHFIIYQLLHVLRSVHNLGLCVGEISLTDISVEQNLWIQVFPKIFSEMEELCKTTTNNYGSIIPEEVNTHLNNEEKMNFNKECISAHQHESFKANDSENILLIKENGLPSLTQKWIRGAISNFDYLLELNSLAGRIMNNPHCHPVIPWIMKFSVPEGGWRDLTKSKFRLNKGDKQLDLIFESSSFNGNATSHGNIANLIQSSAVNIPHHISDVLSDITYYVYKARRLPKSILCKHVRQKWVPAEYPSSIERLQEWSPDECIPEFFSDPTIFTSIHSDLPDLEIPSWCKSPEDFVKRHRACLESDHVSERLHHWIDLTFGYKMTGSAAVKSKNVCLTLVDQHSYIYSHGLVQLFNHPHPHKMSNSLYFSCIAPKTFRSVIKKVHDTKDSGEDETSSESSGKAGRWKVLRSKSMPAGTEQLRSEARPENLTIVLPKDYNPLLAMRQLESFYTFLAKCNGGKQHVYKNQIIMKNDSDYCLHSQSKDMLVLGCIVSEMCLSSHIKSIPQDMPLEKRYFVILHLLKTYKHEVPRCFWQVIQLLLQLSLNFESNTGCIKNEINCTPCRYLPVSICGLPPPSPHRLLQPLIHTIPFPPYFSDLYSFLERLNSYSKQLSDIDNSDVDAPVKQNMIEDIAKTKVYFASKKLHTLLPYLNSEAIDLLIPYLQELFENQYTSLLATWHLFSTVSQSLGPQKTSQKLLKTLIKVFDPDILSSKHMKLYHRTFLLQLIVRLGLQNFLAHFMTVLIEAVGGLKDFLSDWNHGIDSSMEILRRKSSHLQSPELQEMAKESERNLSNPDIPNSSCDPNSSEINSHFQEMDDDKDREIFYFEDPSEDSVKIRKNSEQPSSTSLDVNLDLEDEKCQNLKSADRCSQAEAVRIHLAVPEDDYSEDDEEEEEDDDDPDVIDALTSPVTELRKPSRASVYSRSAPNLTSHLSQYKSSTAEYESEQIISDSHVGESALELGTDVVSTVLSPNSGKPDNALNISDIAVESVLWLAHRLGPVLTARYLTRNLLRMLTLCYEGPEKRQIILECPLNSDKKTCLSVSNRWYSGDRYALKVLDCLSRVAALYGEQFIMLQYIPHIADLLILCKRRISGTLESGLIGAMALLQYIIPYLSDVILMDHLQDVIIKDILYLIIRLISSLRLIFPNGGESRWIITCRLIDIIYVIGLRIGFEMTRTHLSNTIQRFFSCFDKVYEQNGSFKNFQDLSSSNSSSNCLLKERALEEMRQAFTAEMAYISYIPFCKLAGGIFMEHTLKNDELIRYLCVKHDLDMACSSSCEMDENSDAHSSRKDSISSIKSHHRGPSLGQEDSFVSGVFGKNVAVVGNRLDVQLGDESHLVAAVGDPVPNMISSGLSKTLEIPKYDISLLRRKMDNNHRHLKGNWLAYWEHEKGRSEKDDHFNFKQIKLQSFIGHSGAIRTIQVLDNENSFLSSSKDKTVKLWSLRSYGDGSAQTPCQWTYTQHRKSVFAVSFLDSLRLVGSCDSTVHIWDPFMGSCIKQIEPTKGSPITVLTSMPAPSTTFLAATTNSTVRFLDARTCRYMHEFKVSIGTTGLIRCLAVSPNGYWLAIGHSTGMISVLDVRTGFLFGAWMGHEGEILQLKPFNNSYFVTSSLDHCVSVWNAEDSQPKCHLRGPMEPVTSLCFYKGEVISGTAGNKIGLHTSIDRKASYSSTRLRSDTFKGMLTTMALLPLNRLLLMGADNGNLMLLS